MEIADLEQKHGMPILSFPPRCTHKLQLLDVDFVKPL